MQKAYKDASKSTQQISDNTRTDPAAEAPFLKSLDTGRRAVALYAYGATRTDELTFAEGDTIELISTPDEGWWEGRVGVPVTLAVHVICHSTETSGGCRALRIGLVTSES